jgi:N-acetylglucosaminyldiphosphoundecaprenol N-acetyl-beta-D-mannosaminyltransferase
VLQRACLHSERVCGCAGSPWLFEQEGILVRVDQTARQMQCPTATSTEARTVQVLGSTVHLISVTKTVDQIEDWVNAEDRRCRRVIVTGFHGLLEADKDPRLHAIVNSAEIWAPDGIAPVLVARLCGHRNVQRTPGAEIMLEFFRRANQKGYSSYFYGGTDAMLMALSERVSSEYPGHKIVGAFAPPFRSLTPAEDAEVIERITKARPDVLWVGLGMPKQDVWIHERLDRLKVPVAIGVGAAFAFVAGIVPRCPQWIGRMGFEWAYRLFREPQKLWRRDLIQGPEFLLRLAFELTGLRRREQAALPSADSHPG